ncbi:unnamed protein product [Arabidopsis arenosa]|uniref:Uncharacterized protein n=1 Tax=Arabidopsis arenosa TaxID=38785 RepID=A0A8S2AVT9_ARAAE|nr:unnamed protein product [Arabidopsis arenosa]
MEGSKSEAVFDSMNLNPQIFINETINSVEDYVDAALISMAVDESSVVHQDELCRKEVCELELRAFKALERVLGFEGTGLVRLFNEALELYDESSVNEMFKEMAKMASELRASVDRLKTRRMEASESAKVKRLKNHGKEFSAMTFDGKLEDLEKFKPS